jgi:C_GCAxxG_C_C family probable redox protein
LDKSETAAAKMQQGFNCSQSVFTSYSGSLGVPQDLALRIASGFGGGMGRVGTVCGAATGALMVIGLWYGAVDPEDKLAKDQTYAKVQDFLRRFQERYGALDCRDLLGYNISDPDELEKARAAGLFKTRCPALVQGAAQILHEMEMEL